ncbi:MAG: hypothetical protein FJ397_09635, partial [Verrucomicrobia bacterium]|nr:hypothetical protein [Verrucomicrobiota bacterium]
MRGGGASARGCPSPTRTTTPRAPPNWRVAPTANGGTAAEPLPHPMRLTALLLLTLAATIPVSGAGAARPNFLIIIADDLHWRDLGVTGSPDVKTPHIDRLAAEGMNLRAFFTPAPTCSPLRHALYTGLFPIRSGAYPNHTMVDPTTRSVFTHLNGAGYRTALLGKTHVSPESSFPFEHLGRSAD